MVHIKILNMFPMYGCTYFTIIKNKNLLEDDGKYAELSPNSLKKFFWHSKHVRKRMKLLHNWKEGT